MFPEKSIRKPISAKAIAAYSLLFLTTTLAQEKSIALGGSFGYSALQMSAVNSTLDRTVFDWNRFFGLSMKPFDHFAWSTTASIRLSYRYDVEYAFLVSYAQFESQVQNKFDDFGEDGNRYLVSLDRSLAAQYVSGGVIYFFPPLIYNAEAYAFVEAGSVSAKADAKSFGTETVKVADTTSTSVFYDTKRSYGSAKLFLGFGGGLSVAIAGPIRLYAEASYKFAKVGKMDGVVTVDAGTYEEPSITEFDFSILSISVGLSVNL
jgi:hypothetical protein